ncbi:hypothetical protein GALL_542200 [mine drainage metagenome]|uniref:Uncharacterized protein n=1 Tax=mine drainage metagenome TaxID=410659 RepID=A0A1J5PL19_9ZZZZ
MSACPTNLHPRLDASAAAAFGRLDAAAEAMDQVATQMEAMAALVGARERLRRVDEAPSVEALALTAHEAYGLAQILDLIADQLRQAETEVRGHALRQTG